MNKHGAKAERINGQTTSEARLPTTSNGTDAAQAQKKTPSSRLPSQLVAIPNIPNLRPNVPNTPPSSVKPSARITTPSTPDFLKSPQTGIAVQPEARGENRTDEENENVRGEYDVYAQPFIPAAFLDVNRQPGHVIGTASEHRIDATAYIKTFLGSSFIPERVPALTQHAYYQPPIAGIILTEDSYSDYFGALLRSECAAQEVENEKYAMFKIPLLPVSLPSSQERLFSLIIPGLREDTPRIEMGDHLQLRQLSLDAFGNLIAVPVQMDPPHVAPPVFLNWLGTQYNASVHSINRAQETVYLKITGFPDSHYRFGTMGMPPPRAMVNVSFPLKERHLTTQRSALEFVASELKNIYQGSRSLHSTLPDGEPAPNDWIRRMLFPTEADGVLQTQLRRIASQRGLFDTNINFEQLQSVDSVCENEYGVLPFLISGPPGTGKTKTLVELALNLLNTTKIGHILICAPSDPAADTLAQRLKKHLSPKQLLRLNAPSRADNEVPQDLLPYCYIERDMFYLPPFAQFMTFNIVVTSTRDASILAGARLTNTDLFTAETRMRSVFHPESPHELLIPDLHWGALLMDEAAQATELESLHAISVVMPPSTYPRNMSQPRFAMAGDQNQLGPKTASLNTAYSTSLFERLFTCSLYAKHPLSRSSVRPSAGPPVMSAKMLPMLYPPFTNLIRNYRSHPAILAVPSQLFYHDTLIPEAAFESSPLQNSPLWRGRKWPVLFMAHTGADEIERDGGGWYNHSEARIACRIAQRLVYDSGVQQKDIVIMSPFAAQVRVLRRNMRSSAYGNGAGLWDVNIGPLEAFQGLESKVVIICTTRTRSRFLGMDAQRGLGIVHQRRKMNVALTRAKEALFVTGSPDVLSQDPHWQAFLAFCWRNGLVDKGCALWGGNGEGKIGVLEKALLVKEERENARQQTGRVLGAANVPRGLEDDMWTEDLRAALEEYYDDDGDKVEDEDDEGEYEDGVEDENGDSEDESE